MDSLWASRISHDLMDQAMKQSTHRFHKMFFHISKCLACDAEKNITVENNKKRMKITNFVNIYTNICTYIICDKNDSKWKWFNKLMLLKIIIMYYFLLQDFHIWSVSQRVEM